MNARRKMSAADDKAATPGGRPKASSRALAQVIERSSRLQGPAAEAYVARLRRAHPGASPAEIVAKLEKRYLAALTASGAAVGSAATFPGVGTLAAMSAGAGETVFFLEATAVFVLANAVELTITSGGWAASAVVRNPVERSSFRLVIWIGSGSSPRAASASHSASTGAVKPDWAKAR